MRLVIFALLVPLALVGCGKQESSSAPTQASQPASPDVAKGLKDVANLIRQRKLDEAEALLGQLSAQKPTMEQRGDMEDLQRQINIARGGR